MYLDETTDAHQRDATRRAGRLGWAGFAVVAEARRETSGVIVAEPYLEFELPIERGKVREFALAVGEDNPIFFDVEAARREGLPDVVAPPTFTVSQIWQVPREEREERLGARLDYERVLHGEQEFELRRLPFAGEVLKGVMRIARDLTKEGRRGGRMRFVTYESRFTDAQGEEVLTAYYTLIETEGDTGA
ncbi:MAG: MaoC family dehydratase N-terminal domain-containing protein [Actinomycetota bacterium]